MTIVDIWDKALDRVGLTRKSAIADQTLANTAPFALLGNRGGQPDARRALELFVGWGYACVRAIAEELGNLELELYQAKKGGDVRIYDHEVLDLLEGVNEVQTGYELRYLTGAHLEAAGNAYWFLQGVKKPGDKPIAIIPLNPACIRYDIDKTQFPARITNYVYREFNYTKRFEPHEVLHIKYPDPTNSLQGLGTIQAIAAWMEADLFATEFNRRFFLNGARMGALIETDAQTSAQIEVLRKSLEALHKGVENAYRMVILPKGAKLGANPEAGMKDMDFANLSKEMRDKILAGFRIPRTVLGITDDVNRANAEATDYVFALRTIKPKMQMIVSYLNEFLVPLYGPDLYLSFKDPVPENRELEIRKSAAALGNQPYMSVNEVREEQGLEPVEGGDEVMTGFTMQPLGAPAPQPTTEAAGEVRTRGRRKGRPSTKGARVHKARTSIAGELAKIAAEAVKANSEKVTQTLETKSIADLNDDEFEPVYKAFRERVTKSEKLMKRKIQDHNAEQLTEVLNNIEKLNLPEKAAEGKKATVDPKDLLNKKKAVKALIKLGTPLYYALYEQEAKEAALLLGAELTDILTEETRQALDHAIELMATSYTETTLTTLKAKLETAIEVGASLPEVKDLIQDIYEFSDEVRAETVARTEMFRTANNGAKEGWKRSGVVTEIKWYTAADERVCEYCEPMHGQTIDIEENFFDVGDEVEGSSGGKFTVEYDDVSAGSLHTNCRCYTRPVKIEV